MKKRIISKLACVAIFFDLGITVIFDPESADCTKGTRLLAVIPFTLFI